VVSSYHQYDAEIRPAGRVPAGPEPDVAAPRANRVVQPPSNRRAVASDPSRRPTAPKGAGRTVAQEKQFEQPSKQAIEDVSEGVLVRARRVAQETEHELLGEVLDGKRGSEFQTLNNALMDTYRVHSNVDAFTLLFELNMRPFSLIATRIMRMTGSRADLGDVLQETFLAIYRYPTKFCPDKPNAFRNWSYSIIRNTIYRQLQAKGRDGIPIEIFTEILPDERAKSPVQETSDAEADINCRRIYGLVLALYSDIYERDLKPRDQLALHLVEIERLGYREAADQLGIRLENFKMIVCRARKKIFQSLVRTLGTRKS
jgi:RNA polymerase sigma factor (sigma-70 family)